MDKFVVPMYVQMFLCIFRVRDPPHGLQRRSPAPRPMANHWRVTAVLTMLSVLRSSRAFLPVAPGRASRQLSKSSGVRGVVPVDVRSAAAAGCLRARYSEARTGRYGVEGLGVVRGLTSSAMRLSAVGAVNPASRTSSTTLEQVLYSVDGSGTTEFSMMPTSTAQSN